MQALTVITKHTATPQHLQFLFFHLHIWRLLLNFAAKITSMKIVKGEFKEKLELVFAPSIKAGFPSPAEDYIVESLDFNRDLIKLALAGDAQFVLRHPSISFIRSSRLSYL